MSSRVVGGRFEVLEVAGVGGMGTVHRALDRSTGGIVALKLLAPRARSEADRFQREAELLAELRHPCIVGHVAHGAAGDGEAFLAMDWLEGEDLSATLARGPLTLEATLAVAERVASALAAAHDRGVIHRDVKPSNVFLVGGLASEARVLDFGVARIRGDGPQTRTGMVVGTPGYMAPEQARGERGIDARVDVFALGCVLYECLTGEPAFRGDNVLALLARILLDDPIRPSDLVAVPPSVEALIGRMLSKSPAERPADGAAVLAALARAPLSTADGGAPPTALGRDEQEWVSLVFAREAQVADEAQADTLAVGEHDTRQRLAEAVAPIGAEVERLIDGTLMARLSTQGAPRDRAVRAARCALATYAGLDREARVVLVTGRKVRGARAALGGMIDQAAELLSHPAHPDGPRLDGPSAALLDARFEIGGDAKSLALGAERPDDEAPRRLLGQPSPCVGRDREIATLTGLFDECMSESLARVVLVTAPPGAGKSRLRRELSARLAGRSDVPPPLLARADVIRAGSPYGMLRDLVRGAAALRDGEPIDVARRKLSARVGRSVPPAAAPRVTAFLGELVGVPFPDDDLPALRSARSDPVVLGDQIQAAWEDLLSAELALAPCVLLLEDLHWGDLPTIRAIDRALRVLRDRPLFVLATARPEVHEQFAGLFAGRDVQEIRLPPLSPRASERLVRGALGARADDDAVARIVTRSEGNAFLIEELVRAEASGGGGALPETALAITASRLGALDDGARRVLRAASVFGEVFFRGGVHALTSEPGLDAILARLVEAEIVEPRATARFEGEREWCFRHALLRDAAYASLTPADLAAGHRLAGVWLEAQGEHDALVLAEHFDRGGAPSAAASHYVRAAEHALEGNDFAAVVRHARRALACGSVGVAAAACQRLIADAEQWQGNFANAVVAAREAMALFPGGGDGWHRAVLLAAIAEQRLGRTGALAGLARDVLSQTHGPGGEATRVEVLVRLAMRIQFFDTQPLVFELLDAAEAASPPEGDDAVLAWFEAATAIRAHARGDLPVFVLHIGRSAEFLMRAGRIRDALSQLDDQGWWYFHCGDAERAEATSRKVVSEAERMGLRRLEINARTSLMWQLIGVGRGIEAVAMGEPLLAQSLEGGDRRQVRFFVAWALLYEGDVEHALAELAAVSREMPRGSGWWRACRGYEIDALLLLGRADEARAVGEDLADVLRAPGPAHLEIDSWRAIADARRATGDADGAREAIERACERLRDRLIGFSDVGLRSRALATVSYYRRTLERARALGVTPPFEAGGDG